jgi:hypothetical protein
MEQDWTGTSKSVFRNIGASNHSEYEREQYDYYATEPKALELLLELETFNNVWECACGEGHLSGVLKNHNIHSRSSDLIDRGYGEKFDFLSIENQEWRGDIITNPPYKYSQRFIEKALDIIPTGNKVAMFMGIQFLEGKGRKHFYKANPPKTIYISSSRLNCARNGDFEKFKQNSARCYAWYIWEKGHKGDTILKWFN